MMNNFIGLMTKFLCLEDALQALNDTEIDSFAYGNTDQYERNNIRSKIGFIHSQILNEFKHLDEYKSYYIKIQFTVDNQIYENVKRLATDIRNTLTGFVETIETHADNNKDKEMILDELNSFIVDTDKLISMCNDAKAIEEEKKKNASECEFIFNEFVQNVTNMFGDKMQDLQLKKNPQNTDIKKVQDIMQSHPKKSDYAPLLYHKFDMGTGIELVITMCNDKNDEITATEIDLFGKDNLKIKKAKSIIRNFHRFLPENYRKTKLESKYVYMFSLIYCNKDVNISKLRQYFDEQYHKNNLNTLDIPKSPCSIVRFRSNNRNFESSTEFICFKKDVDAYANTICLD